MDQHNCKYPPNLSDFGFVHFMDESVKTLSQNADYLHLSNKSYQRLPTL